MLDYLDVLTDLHRSRQPRTYLEIGIYRGDALRIASDRTLSVGVDPEPAVPPLDAHRWHIEATTSDEFFAGTRPRELFGGQPLDLVFIDGMHLFEFALRDFLNAEALSSPESLIVLHDCLPMDAVTASPERTTDHWTGDVWKLVLCLLDRRPDLDLTTIDIPPSGLCLVRRLDPSNTRLRDEYGDIVEQYGPMGFDEWEKRRADVLMCTASGPETALWAARQDLAALREELQEVQTRATAELDELRAGFAASLAESSELRERLELEITGLQAQVLRSDSAAARARAQVLRSDSAAARAREQFEAVARSRSWRLTAPLRWLATLVRGGGRR